MEPKKWIINGTFCDYFIIFVRTGRKGTIVYHMLLAKSIEGIIIIIYIIIYIYYHKIYKYVIIYIYIYVYIIIRYCQINQYV